MKVALIVIFLCLFAGGFCIVIPVSNTPVITDANLISNFVRCEPKDKLPEPLQTKCWLWQDEDFLVAHFECETDSSFYIGSLTVRDQGQQQDFVRVQLITIPDAYFAYYYSASPVGNMYDAVRNQDLGIDTRWNSKYSYESNIEDKLWTVTMRIPLGELRFKHDLPYNWKIIVSRYHYKDETMFSHPYSHTDMKKDYFLKAQDITLSHKVKRSMNFSFRPYLVRSYDLLEKTSSFDPDNIGMDIAFDPTQRIRIKLSVNPDYSDVPPDDAADNYNSKYPPWLSENRFFFTEDLDVFGSDSDTFYTRNIAKPQLAFKVTGNTKSVNWGLLGALDKEMRDGDMVINSDDYFQVISIKPSWRKLRFSNSILSRINEDYYNHVYEGSLNKQIGESFSAGASLITSINKDASMTKANDGYQWSAYISAYPGDWNASVSAGKCSDDVVIDMGYPFQPDYNTVNWNCGYSSPMLAGKIKYYGASYWGNYSEYYPTTNPTDELSHGSNTYITLNNKISMNVGLNFGTTLDLANVKHDTYSTNVNVSYDRWEALGLSCNYAFGNTVVYQLFDTYKTRLWVMNLWGQATKQLYYEGKLTFRQYSYDKVSTVNGHLVTMDNSYAFVNTDVVYTHSNHLQLRAALSYHNNESGGAFGDLGYHGNLRYEFKPECFIYAGMQNNQYQDQKSTLSNPLGNFKKYGSTAYVKLAVAI
jgi:hypothetical protein